MYQFASKERRRNPKETANVFSLITFFFTRHIFRIGLKRDLIETDVYRVINVCESSKLGDLVETEWNKQSENGATPSFLKVMAKCFGWEYLFIGLNQLVYSGIAVFVEPYLVGKLVAFFRSQQTEITLNEAYFYGAVLVLSLTLKEIYMHNCFLYIFQLATKVRVATCSFVYRKSLRLSYESLARLSHGRVVTIVSKDVYAFDGALFYGNEMWIGFVQVAALTYVIYRSVSYAAFSGVGFMLLIIPIQFFMGKCVTKLRTMSLKKTDERLRLIQEILTTIRIIKMYTWERFYMNRINEERRAEIGKLRSFLYIKHIILSIGQFSWRVSFYLLVITYLYLGEEISAERIFVVLACYGTLRHYMAIGIPLGITKIVEAVAAVQRIKELLCEPSMENAKKEIDERPAIKMDGVVVALSRDRNIFEKLTLHLNKGLIAITGPLGAGKTCVIRTILQDLQIVSGNVHVSGNISYAPQDPWLFPASLKQNILFGEPYDAERYNKVINMCALKSDIDRLPNGDETVIIDKGLNLSRGQQARVNLARAIYKEADIYLLDDPLSALDAIVSLFIFNNCIKGHLKEKICVFVTHEQQYLKEADKVIYLKNGKVVVEGTYDEILASGRGHELLNNRIDSNNELQEVLMEEECGNEEIAETKRLLTKEKIYGENQALGKVNWRMYRTYLQSGNSPTLLFFIVVLFVVAQSSASYFDYFVTRWINVTETKGTNATNSSSVINGFEFSTIYSALIFIVITSDVTRAILFFYFVTTASILFHNRVFDNVMKATMEFFDTHMTGNILNRFAKDIGVIDEELPRILFCLLKIIFVTFGSITLIVHAHYMFIFYSIVFVIVLYTTRAYYMPASRSLKRLDGSTRAPIVGHINATLQGLTTIRAYELQEMLIKQFDRHQNLHTSVAYMLMTISRAFGFYIDMWCKIYLLAIIFTFLTISLDSSSGNVGIAITEAIGLSGLIQYGLRISADMENAMTSIERVEEYAEAKTERGEGVRLKLTDGRVDFEGVHLKYSPDSSACILKNVTFSVAANEKVGIIGRTGAGKSSIISTLFRLYDVAAGEIRVDGVDVRSMNVEYLRSQLSIIPQNPVLFNGTLRTNLDPYKRYTDTVLWRALEAVHVKETVNDLGVVIEEGGTNFSIGQRQLLCLARAVLKQNRILILDEATANIDPYTETLIQKTIVERFANCTVIVVAHRLDTVMSSDKIVVLDKGEVIECDAPRNLLNDKNNDEKVLPNFCGRTLLLQENYSLINIYVNFLRFIDQEVSNNMYECEHEERRKNPKERASIFSLITFFYARDIFRISSRRDLNEDDVYNVLESCESARLGDLVESAWNAECARNPKDPSLFRTLARAFGWEHWTLAVNLIFHRSLFMAFQPYLVERLVTYFKPEQTDVTQTQAYFYGSILTILFVFKHTYAHNCEFLMSQLAIKARAGLSSLIYRKSLSLSQSSVMELSSGRIITLINKDIYTLDETIICANEICMGTIELCVMSYIMYVAIGTPALIAVGIIFISLPIQVLLAKYTTKLREECGAITDERLRLIQEILSTIRVIKMYTWERFYATRTCKERKAEMKKLRLITYVRGLVMILGKFSIKISFYACVMIYLYYGGIMRTEKIFVVLTCYSSIKSVLGVEIPLAFAFLSETRAAMHRITRLLYEPSLHVDGEEAKNASKGANAVPMVKLDDVIVTLNAKKIFDGVSLEFREGLIALTGPLGAGKSCLLKTILRDLRIVSGNVVVNGKVSYASQEPWIFPGTIKQNILFGQPYEPERYQRVLDVCALRSDVDCLPEGDDTVLIDKGLNLSRGQQTRVNLARAIYRDADIYLLDDTLSALDTNVSSYIFANCFKDFLKNKLCVIVMEQMLYLQDIDKILYIKDGKVTAEGSYEEIMRGKYGEELLKNRIDFEQEIDKIVADETNFPEAMENLEASDRGGLMLLNKKNVYYEEKKLGKIDWETFEVYLKSGRPLYVLFVAIGAFLVATTCGTYFDYFVTKWTDAEETIYNLTLLNMTNSSEYETAMAQKLQVPKLYTTLIAVIVAMHVVETALYFHYTMSISINLHNDIFGKMIRATMKFFDLHLTGNILNRFAKDMTQIDERLPNTFYEGLGMIFWTGGIFVLIASAHYVFILYTIILILILFMMRTRYMPAGRSLNRLDASTRAPVIGHINATLEGLTIIRASEVQKVLMKQFDKHQDLHSSATHMNLTASRAFGFYLDVFCIGYISAIIFTFLSAPSESSASSVGLAVTQSLSLSWLVQRVIRNTAAMEQSLTSVERVIEYSKAELEDDKIGRTVANWPTRGRIEFRRVALRYASNPEPMLADLSFTIEPKQKIGVIGRTGAGKSSIISILFRLYEIDGQILIDGQDIGELNLKFLRASLSIIPQSPVLFTGTLRSNLDPNGEYADESLWKALEAVDIRGIVNDLDAKIEEGGSNFSIGQKQLLCLARALLRKNKILILDEATANVDTNTDVLIQKTIADHFTEFTVITIAHRLNTVMGHDKILVMDRGRVIEFDTTKNLLRNHGSRFYCMAKNAGLVS